jgi:hypothetical protein
MESTVSSEFEKKYPTYIKSYEEQFFPDYIQNYIDNCVERNKPYDKEEIIDVFENARYPYKIDFDVNTEKQLCNILKEYFEENPEYYTGQYIKRLPGQIMKQIFEYLPETEIPKIKHTSKQFLEISEFFMEDIFIQLLVGLMLGWLYGMYCVNNTLPKPESIIDRNIARAIYKVNEKYSYIVFNFKPNIYQLFVYSEFGIAFKEYPHISKILNKYIMSGKKKIYQFSILQTYEIIEFLTNAFKFHELEGDIELELETPGIQSITGTSKQIFDEIQITFKNLNVDDVITISQSKNESLIKFNIEKMKQEFFSNPEYDNLLNEAIINLKKFCDIYPI